jgi:hypothetical protein
VSPARDDGKFGEREKEGYEVLHGEIEKGEEGRD